MMADAVEWVIASFLMPKTVPEEAEAFESYFQEGEEEALEVEGPLGEAVGSVPCERHWEAPEGEEAAPLYERSPYCSEMPNKPRSVCQKCKLNGNGCKVSRTFGVSVTVTGELNFSVVQPIKQCCNGNYLPQKLWLSKRKGKLSRMVLKVWFYSPPPNNVTRHNKEGELVSSKRGEDPPLDYARRKTRSRMVLLNAPINVF